MGGASPEDPVMLECTVPKQRSSKRKRRKRKEANELEAVVSESSASDKMSCGKESDEDKDGDRPQHLHSWRNCARRNVRRMQVNHPWEFLAVGSLNFRFLKSSLTP